MHACFANQGPGNAVEAHTAAERMSPLWYLEIGAALQHRHTESEVFGVLRWCGRMFNVFCAHTQGTDSCPCMERLTVSSIPQATPPATECPAVQALDGKLEELVAGVQQSLHKASSSFRASVAAFLSDFGEKPDWRAHPERFTFWAARWLPLSARDKITVRYFAVKPSWRGCSCTYLLHRSSVPHVCCSLTGCQFFDMNLLCLHAKGRRAWGDILQWRVGHVFV